MRSQLSAYFATKKSAAQTLAEQVKKLYNNFTASNITVPDGTRLADLPSSVYWDSDVPTTLPKKTFKFDS